MRLFFSQKRNSVFLFFIEMGSSYTWCNSYKITTFLHRRFLKDLMAKKISLNAIAFHLTPNTGNFFSLSLFNVLLFFTWLKVHAIFNNLETILIYVRANAQQPKLFVGWFLFLFLPKHWLSIVSLLASSFIPKLVSLELTETKRTHSSGWLQLWLCGLLLLIWKCFFTRDSCGCGWVQLFYQYKF